MNNRVAKKILQCVSALHKNVERVKIARRQVLENPAWFTRKGIFIVETPFCNGRTLHKCLTNV